MGTCEFPLAAPNVTNPSSSQSKCERRDDGLGPGDRRFEPAPPDQPVHRGRGRLRSPQVPEDAKGAEPNDVPDTAESSESGVTKNGADTVAGIDLRDVISSVVEFPEGITRIRASDTLADRLILYQLIYSLVGLSLGLVCTLLGFALLLRGVTGSTGWAIELLGVKSTLSDAAPGTVLAVVGLLMIFVTRLDIKVRK